MQETIDQFTWPEQYAKKEEPVHKSFFELYYIFLTSKENLSEGRKKHYKVFINILKRYELYTKEYLNLGTLTPQSIQDIADFMKNEHTFFKTTPEGVKVPKSKYQDIYRLVPETRLPGPRGDNYIRSELKILRTFVLWAIKNGHTTNNPFQKYTISSETYGKPIYIDGDLFSGTYKRNSTGDYHCSKDEVRSMLRDQGSQTVDTKILTGMNLSVLNRDSIMVFRINHRNTQLNHPWSNLTDKEFLIRIGAAAVSDTDGKAHPTGAGLLMFGNEYEIVREYPNYFLDFREMVNDITEWTDRIWSTSGDWSGNIFDFYRRIVTRIVQDLKVPLRLDDDTPQHKAVREALANCLVNADYYGRGGIVILKRRDRLVFENPGSIRIGKEKMLESGLSDPRNSVIIKMFSMLHIGERAGSGMNRIISAWPAAGYENPIVEEHIGNIERTTLTLPLTQVLKCTQEMLKGTQGTAKGTQVSTRGNGSTDTSNGESTQKNHSDYPQEINGVFLTKTTIAILNAIIV